MKSKKKKKYKNGESYEITLEATKANFDEIRDIFYCFAMKKKKKSNTCLSTTKIVSHSVICDPH